MWYHMCPGLWSIYSSNSAQVFHMNLSRQLWLVQQNGSIWILNGNAASTAEPSSSFSCLSCCPPGSELVSCQTLPFQSTDRETDTRDSHNKHLEPFPSTSVINEPGYPQSSRVSLDVRSGFVTNGALWVPGYQSCESPREASVWRAQASNWGSPCT